MFGRAYEALRGKLHPATAAPLDVVFVRVRRGGDLVGLTRHGRGSKLQA